jgi:putative ABC transport system substrate-binding protein
MKDRKLFIVIAIILLLFVGTNIFNHQKSSKLPIVAIANYGPHSSLQSSIIGIQEELARQGFVDHQNIDYQIADVSFDSSLIPQMITKFKNQKPQVIIVATTPVAEFAKGSIKDIPLVYDAVTDPVESHLIKEENKSDGNMTGSSDRQDLTLLLQFVKKLLPKAKRIGLLYSTAESNDNALVKMMQRAADQSSMQLVTIGVDQARDVPGRMQIFKDKVDFIYVGTSGPIQPTLPAIVAEADKMAIPVFNADEQAVKDGMVLASYGVDYKQVGVNTAKLVADILRQIPIEKIVPIYPGSNDHHGFINQKKAKEFGIEIPKDLTDVTII